MFLRVVEKQTEIEDEDDDEDDYDLPGNILINGSAPRPSPKGRGGIVTSVFYRRGARSGRTIEDFPPSVLGAGTTGLRTTGVMRPFGSWEGAGRNDE